MSSSSINLRVNPSAASTTLKLYNSANLLSGTWTSTAAGWQTVTIPIAPTQTAKPGFSLQLATPGTINVNWFHPTLTRVEAENAVLSGGATASTSCIGCSGGGGGGDVTDVVSGSILQFAGLNFGTGISAMYMRLAAPTYLQGTLNLYIDAPNASAGTLVGSIAVSSTGGSTNFQTVPIPFFATGTSGTQLNSYTKQVVSGKHDLYVVAACDNTLNNYINNYPTCAGTGLASPTSIS